MLFRTHILFALVIFMLFILNSSLTAINKLIFFTVFIFAAALPDIDTPKSTVGKKVKPLSNFINIFFNHRGFFQSFTFIIILTIVLIIFKIPFFLVVAISLGYTSHLVLDCFTKTGLRILWPLKIQAKGPIKTASLTETLLFIAFFIVFIYLIFKNSATFENIASSIIRTIFSS